MSTSTGAKAKVERRVPVILRDAQVQAVEAWRGGERLCRMVVTGLPVGRSKTLGLFDLPDDVQLRVVKLGPEVATGDVPPTGEGVGS